MIRRRAIVSLCVISALALSAFSAQSATAATKGTTAFTCKETGPGGGFTKPHCTPSDAGSGNFSHITVEENTTTAITGNNKNDAGEKIPGFMTTTVFGATVELTGGTAESEGWMKNTKEGNEHYIYGEGTLTFREAKVLKPSGCEIRTDLPGGELGEVGVIHTEVLKATTKGQGDRGKLEPKEGTAFARFWITGAGCSINSTFTITGSITGVPNGATGSFTEADTTAQNTLKMNGAKVGLTGTGTGEGRDPSIEGDAFRALGATTVETA